jgi:hypothetical protein
MIDNSNLPPGVSASDSHIAGYPEDEIAERTARIEWEATQYSTVGTVRGRWLFSISWGMVRDSKTPWQLYTKLPFKMKNCEFADKDEAQEYAERVLVAFVRSLGAEYLSES